MASPLVGYNTNVRHHGKLFHIQTEDSGVSHGHIFTHLFADGGRIVATKKSSYAQWIGTERYPLVVKKLMQAQHKAMFIALRDGLFDVDEIAGAKAFLEREITLEDEPTQPIQLAVPSRAEVDGRVDVEADALDRAAAEYLSKTPSFAGDAPRPAPAAVPPAVRPPAATPAAPIAARASAPVHVAPPAAAPIRAREPSIPSASISGSSLPSAAPVAPSAGRYQQTQPASSSARPRPVAPKVPEASVFGADVLSEKSLDEVIMSYLAEDLDEKE